MIIKRFIFCIVLLISFSVIGEVQSNELNSPEDPPFCMAGGCGATSCEFSGGIGVGAGSVEVTNAVECEDGYFACCHLTAYCFSTFRCPIIPE